MRSRAAWQLIGPLMQESCFVDLTMVVQVVQTQQDQQVLMTHLTSLSRDLRLDRNEDTKLLICLQIPNLCQALAQEGKIRLYHRSPPSNLPSSAASTLESCYSRTLTVPFGRLPMA